MRTRFLKGYPAHCVGRARHNWNESYDGGEPTLINPAAIATIEPPMRPGEHSLQHKSTFTLLDGRGYSSPLTVEELLALIETLQQ